MPRPRPTRPVEENTVTENTAVENAPAVTDPAAPQEEAPTTDGRAGRPRPQHTLERDQKVLAFLVERGTAGQYDWTVKAVAEATGMLEKEVYACMNRLSWGDGNQKAPSNPLVYKPSRSVYRATQFSHIVVEAPAVAPTATPDAETPAPVTEAPADTTATWA